jgi:hypothetical protein
MVLKSGATLELRLDNKVIRSVKERHVQPSEMLSVKIGPEDFEGHEVNSESVLEFIIN